MLTTADDKAYRIELPTVWEQLLCLDLSADGSVAAALLASAIRDVPDVDDAEDANDARDAVLCQFSLYCAAEFASCKNLLRLTKTNDLPSIVNE